jgi:3D-(3,5/4)-trihydroxycyclohexane-1,2-dione acylhydrolase (decyclizing)
LSLPQDVQAEAFDYPVALFEKRVWHVARNRPDVASVARAVKWIREAKRPFIIAGGGTIYSEATETLRQFVEETGIPVGETMAGKGSLRYDHPLCMGAVGATGTLAANRLAKEADLIIGICTRYSDFTTASKTAFQNPDVRFININVAEFDAYKHNALPLVGDAQVTLVELLAALDEFRVDSNYEMQTKALHDEWEAEVQRIYDIRHEPLVSQGELIGAVNDVGDPEAVMVCAAGSLPGDLHKLWRSRHAKQYHLEYGYSCMGYEIAGGLGIKMADPEREVYVLVGDGSYLMLSADIVTSVQEGYKLTIVLMDNRGFKSIGALSRSIGSQGFGTRYVFPEKNGLPDDTAESVQALPVDLAANARSLGAHVIECTTYDDFVTALATAKENDRTTVIFIQNDRYVGVPGYESWWDVPIAEVSEMHTVQAAREEWNNLGWHYDEENKTDKALNALQNARTWHYKTGSEFTQMVADFGVAHALRRTGKLKEAREMLISAFARAKTRYAADETDKENGEWVGWGHKYLADLMVDEGNKAEALLEYKAARPFLVAANIEKWGPELLKDLDDKIAALSG